MLMEQSVIILLLEALRLFGKALYPPLLIHPHIGVVDRHTPSNETTHLDVPSAAAATAAASGYVTSCAHMHILRGDTTEGAHGGSRNKDGHAAKHITLTPSHPHALWIMDFHLTGTTSYLLSPQSSPEHCQGFPWSVPG
eukprot:1152683-Pelagomonas_calceolata.AAC.7